ncbi:MAG: VWA domain-containing protein [Chloroflexi bacterium]|nr:VWA domain-containing protein [Chloroflexota bacterium]
MSSGNEESRSPSSLFRQLYRYSRWDGTQEVSPFDPDELIDSIADELLGDGDVRTALQRILQRGFQNQQGDRTMGLQRILERLRSRRQEQLDRYDLGGLIDQIKEKLDDVVRTEREGIDRRLADARGQGTGDGSQESDGTSGTNADPQAADAQGGPQPPSPNPQSPSPLQMLENIASRKQEFLNQLPSDLGGAVQALNDYEFMDPEAREKFQELLRMLQQQMMQSYFQGLQQSMQSMTPQDLAGLRQMLQDLNQMLRDRADGREPEFEQFMERWGDAFPEGIESLDDLVQSLQDRIGQMQSLLQSMSPEQRRQLQEMAEQLMGQAGMGEELAELAGLIERLSPAGAWQRQFSFHGDEPLSLVEAMHLMEHLQEIDALERQVQQARDLSNIDQIDVDRIRELLGEDAAQSVEQLQQLQRILEEAGYITRRGGELELTARGMRRIGEKALQDIFQHLKRDSFGKHPINYRGAGGERVDETKVYEYGDPFALDMEQTLMNSVVREGPGTPVRLAPGDFEVYRHELVSQSSTVIMLDMSRSMFLRGCILAAKKVTVALNSLIKGLYPRDNLYIIAFSYYARQISPEDLPRLSWSEWGYGTNMQHAFMVSRQLLARHNMGNKQVILVTDGEPTAYFEGGQIEFSYPPTYRTFQETLREVGRCTRENIVINTFMMERGRYLTDFVDQMTKINRGRAFYATPDRLGEYILVDYVDNKRKVIR